MATSQLESPFDITNPYNLYIPGQPYTASELSAMSYQGMLRPQFGPYYVDIDLPDTASQRAKSVKMAAEQLIEGSWTATLLTAAWIYLGGQAPEMLEAATAEQHRGMSRAKIIAATLRHCDYLHREDLNDQDLRIIGGVMVTSPELTIEELLKIGGSQRHQHKAQQLCQHADAGTLRRRLSAIRTDSDSTGALLAAL